MTASGGIAGTRDEELLAYVAGGDADAFAALYDRHARVAYGMALRVVRDSELAEDAVQDAFLDVWRSAARFDARRASASTWILTLVHRRAVDLVRRQERGRSERAFVSSLLPEESAEDLVQLRDEQRRVQEALARLTAPQRHLLELAYYGGLTQSELAERLGLPLGTVKSRTYAALTRLRELLAAPDTDGCELNTPLIAVCS